MKVIIIDDDNAAINILSGKLKTYDNLQVVGTATTGSSGLHLAATVNPEVIFLDVELPDMSGLEFLEQVNEIVKGWCQVVMYTGYSTYMLPAFRREAFDYLLKPVDDNELEQVVQRINAKRLEKLAESPLSKGVVKKNEDKLLFYTNAIDFRLVHIQDICLFQYNHELRVWEVIVAGKKEPIRLKRNANNESLLAIDNRFIQVSQKFIININYLLEVSNNICVFYPPFEKLDYVKVGRLFRKKLIERFEAL